MGRSGGQKGPGRNSLERPQRLPEAGKWGRYGRPVGKQGRLTAPAGGTDGEWEGWGGGAGGKGRWEGRQQRWMSGEAMRGYAGAMRG